MKPKMSGEELDRVFEKHTYKAQSLSSAIGTTLSMYASHDELAAYTTRVIKVKNMWKAVVEACTGGSASFILDRTNSVYIVRNNDEEEVSRETSGKTADGKNQKPKFGKRNNGKELIVYVEDSLTAAELDARREMMKLKFLELFNEDLDSFHIKISRGHYKDRHPYREDVESEVVPLNTPREPLTAQQINEIDEMTASIPNEHVREALKKAIISDFEVKKAKNTAEGENPAL